MEVMNRYITGLDLMNLKIKYYLQSFLGCILRIVDRDITKVIKEGYISSTELYRTG